MQLISINTWGGILYEPLMDFVDRYRDATDIFCFQEVFDKESSPAGDRGERSNRFEELSARLRDHNGYFARKVSGSGLATFVKKNIEVANSETHIVLSTEEMAIKFNPRILQHVALAAPRMHIYKFHGVPKSDKLDTPERKIQTERVMEIMSRDSGPKILAGDFNLRPETESLRAFESGMINHVIKNGCTTTRSRYYEYRALQPFADYVFTSDITVKDFRVLEDEVSDHLPLILDFE